MSKYMSLILLIVLSNAQDDIFHIELTNERNYPVFVNATGEYNIKAGKTQRVFKVNGITNNSKIERIEWRTKNAFSWNDGTRSEDFPVVNSLTYTKKGVGTTMVGLLPEMKGSTVSIYGFYKGQIDSVKIHIQ
jgi:hypothetical protein|tara:strand:+ start:1488 stop:1886 length:399 start_codon:yes stop_codon:yes gene_type:complete